MNGHIGPNEFGHCKGGFFDGVPGKKAIGEHARFRSEGLERNNGVPGARIAPDSSQTWISNTAYNNDIAEDDIHTVTFPDVRNSTRWPASIVFSSPVSSLAGVPA